MSKPTAADRIAAALAATKKPEGRPNLIDLALEQMDSDERDAWVEVLSDEETYNAEWVWRAMRTAGVKVGSTESAVKTWRRNHLHPGV